MKKFYFLLLSFFLLFPISRKSDLNWVENFGGCNVINKWPATSGNINHYISFPSSTDEYDNDYCDTNCKLKIVDATCDNMKWRTSEVPQMVFSRIAKRFNNFYLENKSTSNDVVLLSSCNALIYKPWSIPSISVITSIDGCKNDGKIEVTVSGATGALQYALTDPKNFEAGSSNIFTGLPSGLYTINVWDAVFKGYSDGRATTTIARGENLPEGTYFYILKYFDEVRHKMLHKSGYLYI